MRGYRRRCLAVDGMPVPIGIFRSLRIIGLRSTRKCSEGRRDFVKPILIIAPALRRRQRPLDGAARLGTYFLCCFPQLLAVRLPRGFSEMSGSPKIAEEENSVAASQGLGRGPHGVLHVQRNHDVVEIET